MYQEFCFWRFNRFFIFKMMHKQLLWQSSSENFFPLPSFAMFDRVRGSLCPGFLLWPSTVLRRSIWHLKFEMSNSEIGAGGDVELSKWFCRDSVKGSLLTYRSVACYPVLSHNIHYRHRHWSPVLRSQYFAAVNLFRVTWHEAKSDVRAARHRNKLTVKAWEKVVQEQGERLPAFYTAVSIKFAPQKCKSLRDNADW